MLNRIIGISVPVLLRVLCKTNFAVTSQLLQRLLGSVKYVIIAKSCYNLAQSLHIVVTRIETEITFDKYVL